MGLTRCYETEVFLAFLFASFLRQSTAIIPIFWFQNNYTSNFDFVPTVIIDMWFGIGLQIYSELENRWCSCDVMSIFKDGGNGVATLQRYCNAACDTLLGCLNLLTYLLTAVEGSRHGSVDECRRQQWCCQCVTSTHNVKNSFCWHSAWVRCASCYPTS